MSHFIKRQFSENNNKEKPNNHNMLNANSAVANYHGFVSFLLSLRLYIIVLKNQTVSKTVLQTLFNSVVMFAEVKRHQMSDIELDYLKQSSSSTSSCGSNLAFMFKCFTLIVSQAAIIFFFDLLPSFDCLLTSSYYFSRAIIEMISYVGSHIST